MIRKLLFISLGALSVPAVLAMPDNSGFQQFQDEYNIGYGYEQGGLKNGSADTSSFDAQTLNIEIERLFNDGIWLDGSFNMVTNYSQPNLGSLNGGNGSSNINGNGLSATCTTTPCAPYGAEFGQDPFMFGFDIKAGYAFQVVNQTLQLTPYVMLGQSENWATSTVVANGGHNLSTDYFYNGGLGGRISYKINSAILVYADGLYTYNWDNSGAIKNIQTSPELYGKTYAATNYETTGTLGAKFNVVKNLQLGLNGYWTSFQPQSNISAAMYTPTNIFGGEVTVGLTY